MNVYGYVRVSTEEQATDGVSIDAQTSKIRAYCELYELTLVEVVCDPGVSAKTLDRPGLTRVLDALNAGTIGGVVVAKLDRLTRSISDWNVLIDRHFNEKAGHRLFSIADSVDTSTAAGRMVLNVFMTVAQWEREVIAERTREVLHHKIAKGERVGSIRFGFDLAPDGKTLVKNEPEQRAIEFMKRMRSAGNSFYAIAMSLVERQIPTKTGNTTWHKNSVARILARC